MKIFYKNGEIRSIQLNKTFFTYSQVSIATRALDIAHSHNPEPWKIFVFKDGVEKYKKIIERNAPKSLKSFRHQTIWE